MIAYFDSSSIVKWFFDEPLMEMATEIRDSTEIAVTSLIAFPEVMSAFNRARKEKRCTQSERDLVRSEFQNIWPDFQKVKLNDMLAHRAGELIFRHNLKGFDSLHLASALLLKEENRQIEVFFSSFDNHLNKAASKEGFLTHQSL
jgi:uncharacterized protein